MSKYSLILSPGVPVNTKITVWELCSEGESLIQQFMNELSEDSYLFDKLAGAMRIIEHSSNMILLPKTKFRQIEGHKLGCKIFEAKSDLVRVYLFHEENTGRIIVAGGKKGNQEKDIKQVIKTIKAYQDERK